ncbi:putative Fe-S protein YdhL (DUF1289 family) [Pseudomonas sp. TE3786]
MGDSKDPCISICKFDERICIGCGRSKEEIKGWKKMDKPEKRAVLAEAQQRLKGMGKKKGKRK